MRIVFVAWQGAEHTRRWAGFFAARGHEVHVVTCGRGEDVGTDQASPYVVHDLGAPRFGKVGYLLKIPRARRLIRSLAPDVVHAHYATSYGFLALTAGVHPLVVTSHGSDLLVSARRGPMRLVVKRVLAAADLITVPAVHVSEAAAALVGDDRKLVVFQYGVEVERLRTLAARVRQSARRDPVRIATVRPLVDIYHTDDVVRAVALLQREGLECMYDVADRGPERAELERLSHRLGVADRVVFHGYLPEREAELLLAAAHIFVSVAETDGASIALLEAMALGAVPVVSDIRANRLWIADGVNGVVVSIEPRSIADGIRRALDLDSAEVYRRNLEIVAARADRDSNLAACEAMLAELVAATPRERES